jgi:truncated hemoglobin YjbI
VYLDRLRGLREAKESLEHTTSDEISGERAFVWLRTLSATWMEADLPEAKAELLHAIYERITVAGPEIV